VSKVFFPLMFGAPPRGTDQNQNQPPFFSPPATRSFFFGPLFMRLSCESTSALYFFRRVCGVSKPKPPAPPTDKGPNPPFFRLQLLPQIRETLPLPPPLKKQRPFFLFFSSYAPLWETFFSLFFEERISRSTWIFSLRVDVTTFFLSFFVLCVLGRPTVCTLSFFFPLRNESFFFLSPFQPCPSFDDRDSFFLFIGDCLPFFPFFPFQPSRVCHLKVVNRPLPPSFLPPRWRGWKVFFSFFPSVQPFLVEKIIPEESAISSPFCFSFLFLLCVWFSGNHR